MAQNVFDQLSKQYLEEFLAPMGTVQRQYEIPGEAKFVDVWFVPNPGAPQANDLGLLGRLVQKPCLLEPYRNVPTGQPRRNPILRLLASWHIRMDLGELLDFVEQEEVMALSEAFLAWKQETKGEGRQEGRQEEKIAIALNLLQENIPLDTIARTTGLTIAQLQQLQSQNKALNPTGLPNHG